LSSVLDKLPGMVRAASAPPAAAPPDNVSKPPSP
jgi:hypothetical protein